MQSNNNAQVTCRFDWIYDAYDSTHYHNSMSYWDTNVRMQTNFIPPKLE